MQIRDLKEWINKFDDEEEVKCWLKVGQCELSEPNMATITVGEIFEFEDKLSALEYDRDNKSNNMTKLFLLCFDLLDELESRLQLDPEFIAEMQEFHAKIETGDMSDFVEVKLPEFTIWDKVNDLYDAKTIEEYVEASERVISHIKHRLEDVECYIDNSNITLVPINNVSISTSIIAILLDIEAKDIDDRRWEDKIWKIPIIKR